MSEITIIQPLEEERPLSKEEREVLYQDISNKYKIPYAYLEELGNLEDLYLARQTKELKSDMLVLMIRRIMDFQNVIPIVKDKIITTQTVEGFLKEFDHNQKIRMKGGSLAKKSKSTINLEFAKNTFYTPTQLIKHQRVVYAGSLSDYLNTGLKSRDSYVYVEESEKIVEVCGFIIIPDETVQTYFDDSIKSSSIIDRIKTGNYTEQYLWDILFSPYFQSSENRIKTNLADIGIGNKKLNLIQTSKTGVFYTLFHSEQEAKNICNLFSGYFTDLTYYQLSDYIDIFLDNVRKDETINPESSNLYKSIQNKLLEPLNAVVNVTPDFAEFKHKEIRKFLGEIEKEGLISGKLNYLYNSSVWSGLADSNMTGLLEKLMFIHGNIDKNQKQQYENDVESMLDLKRVEKTTKIHDFMRNQQHNIIFLKEMTYRWLYVRKFGLDKLQNIKKNMPKYGNMLSEVIGTHGDILDYLNPKEKEIVLKEYKNLQEKQSNPKVMVWTSVVDGIKRSTNKKERIYLLKELQKYLPQKYDKTDWIRSSDNVIIICPHLLDLIKMESENMNENDIHNSILEYASDTPIYQEYFCKICGEHITYAENMESITMFEGNQSVVWHTLGEDLKDFIWKQTNHVVRGNIEFKDVHTSKFTNMFITNITIKLYEFINLIEKMLVKSKTSSLDEIHAKKKLYTVIYIYAIIIKIMLDNPGMLTFVGLASKFGKIDVHKLLSFCSAKIVLTQNIIITQIKDITDEFIESSLNKAYKNIILVVDKTKIESPPEMDLSMSIALDPIYHYLTNMMTISIAQKVKLNSNDTVRLKKISDESYEFSKIFKVKDFRSLNRSEHIYHDIKLPEYPKTSLDLFSNKDEIMKLVHDKKTFGKDKLAKYINEFAIQSFIGFTDYLLSGIYLGHIFDIQLIENKFGIHDVITNPTPEYKAVLDKIQPIRKVGQTLFQMKKMIDLRAYSRIPDGTKEQFRDLDLVNTNIKMLTRKYGSNINSNFNLKLLTGSLEDIKIGQKNYFHKHKWDIYVYVNYSKFTDHKMDKYKPTDLIYLGKKDIKAMGDKFYDYRIIDTLCRICLYPLGDIDKHVENIGEILEIESKIGNFYNFYEYRCPEAGSKDNFHDFIDDKCRKCDFVKKMYISKDKDYYTKYYTKFVKDVNIKPVETMTSMGINAKQENPVSIIPDIILKWKFNNNITNEFISKTSQYVQNSMKLKKTEYFNMVLNMGLSERYEYELIMSGAEMPYKTINENPDLTSIRIHKLDIYIKEIIYDYTTLLNYKNLMQISPEMKSVLDSSSHVELEKVSKLPNIRAVYSIGNMTYFDIIKIIRRLDPVLTSDFLLEYILQLILMIYTKLHDVSAKFAQGYFIYMISKIFNDDRSAAKMKEAKAAAIESIQQPDLIDDPNMQDHRQSRIDDDLVKPGKKTDFDYDFDYEPQSLDVGGYNQTM